MSVLLRFVPSVVVALAGAGLQLGGYESRWWGNALLIAAVIFACVGFASLWIQQYLELRAARTALQQESPKIPQDATGHREQIKQVTTERDALREEKLQNLEERRRWRIRYWRQVVNRFDFNSDGFAGTDAYAQMKPYLQPEVIEMFEAPRTVHIGNPARGDTTYRYTLLDEIARIEREWELI